MKEKIKFDVNNCYYCGENHIGYTVKIDRNKREYVVCGRANKKIMVKPLCNL